MGPKKILAIKLRALGDTVLLTAPLMELKRQLPESQIHVLVPSVWAPVLRDHPAVSRIWTIDRSLKGLQKKKQELSLALKLRNEGFDSVLAFHASPSSALLARFLGAETRSIHFHGHQDSNRYSTVLVPGKGELKPVIERDMDTLRALGLNIQAGLLPFVPISDSEVKEAQALLKIHGMKKPLLALNLGASRPTKLWPVESFAALALKWCEEQQGSVLALGGPTEKVLIEKFLSSVSSSSFRGQIHGTSELSLRTLAAVLNQASVLAGGDSGPKHLAVAVGTPTVTLFGPEDPFEWHPYPKEKNPYLFIENLNCRRDADPGYPAWCALRECVIEKHRCMRELSVESVLASCQKVVRSS